MLQEIMTNPGETVCKERDRARGCICIDGVSGSGSGK